MSQVSSTGSTSSTSSSSSADSNQRGNGLQDLNLDQFLKLIVTELQNQDPLSPTDNAALMQQVGQLRSMAADDKLTSTLTNFSITQELTTASTLIGQKVDGLDDTGKAVNGVVNSVSVVIDEKDRTKRQVRVQVGTQNVDIKNIRQINQVPTTSSTGTTTGTSATTNSNNSNTTT